MLCTCYYFVQIITCITPSSGADPGFQVRGGARLKKISKNKSRIIIQKCRNFCKQLTLPGRTVQQLPFFKTVRLYTGIKGQTGQPYFILVQKNLLK